MYKFLIWLLSPIVKFLIRVKLEGEVNVPDGEKFVICANHLSNWDPVLVVVCTKIPIQFMAKESLFKVPLLSSFLRSLGTISIKRNEPEMAPIKKSIEVIEKGGHFSLFPQGKRLHVPPHPDQAKKGVGFICGKSQAGVLPIGIYTKGYRIMPFRKVYVRIGDFVPYSELDFGEGKPDWEKASRQIFEKICDLAEPVEK